MSPPKENKKRIRNFTTNAIALGIIIPYLLYISNTVRMIITISLILFLLIFIFAAHHKKHNLKYKPILGYIFLILATLGTFTVIHAMNAYSDYKKINNYSKYNCIATDKTVIEPFLGASIALPVFKCRINGKYKYLSSRQIEDLQ